MREAEDAKLPRANSTSYHSPWDRASSVPELHLLVCMVAKLRDVTGACSGVEGCCRFYLKDQRRCKADPWASPFSHLRLFAFFGSFIHSVDVKQPKKLKASPEAPSFTLCTSSSGLKKLTRVISRKQLLPGRVFNVTL